MKFSITDFFIFFAVCIVFDYFKEDSEYFSVTEASQLIKQSNIALIKTGDEHPYYFLKLSCNPYITESSIADGYNHVFSTKSLCY